MRENSLKRLWQEDKTAINAWLTIPSAWTAELMAGAGYDSLTIDMQHGLMDYETALAMLQAISTTPVVPLARVPWNEPAMIMRLLDAGAYGIICPMVNSRQEAEAFVQACRYPPDGIRSYGPFRAELYSGQDYYANANRTVLVFAMIETAQALERAEEIAATPGLDGIYVGAVDLSISLGLPELVDHHHPQVKSFMDTILQVCQKYGLIVGAHTSSPENAAELSRRGVRLLTPATDTTLLRMAAKSTQEQTRAKTG